MGEDGRVKALWKEKAPKEKDLGGRVVGNGRRRKWELCEKSEKRLRNVANALDPMNGLWEDSVFVFLFVLFLIKFFWLNFGYWTTCGWLQFLRDPFAPLVSKLSDEGHGAGEIPASMTSNPLQLSKDKFHPWVLLSVPTHTLKYYLHPFPPPMYTSLKYTRVWYPRSRVSYHCAWMVSNISAEAMASQTLPRHAETSETQLSPSAKPVKVSMVSYTHPFPIAWLWYLLKMSTLFA